MRGLLSSQGPGKRRSIVLSDRVPSKSLRLAILTYEPLALTEGYILELQHLLAAAGHTAFFTGHSVTELGSDTQRISKLVANTTVDAWLIVSAPREMLEWFASRPIPVFALFGRRRGLPIAGAGPDKRPATLTATRRLFELGHRRIVYLARRARRLPEPGAVEKAYLAELAVLGLTTSRYNLPDWEETVSGFHECLTSLFRMTPPTALVVDESQFFLAAQQFCARKGLRVPEDVSLICTDDDPHFAWFTPEVTHIRWDRKPVVRRIVRWAAMVSKGKADLRQILTRAEFVEGGTIGPARTACDIAP